LTPYAQKFPNRVQTVYIQAVPKLFSACSTEITSSWTPDGKVEFEFMIEQIIRWMDPFRYSADLEVQERSVGFHQIFQNIHLQIQEIPTSGLQSNYRDEATENWGTSRPPTSFQCLADLMALFGDIELNPVGAKAQRKVPIPVGLDLHTSLFPTQPYISWPNDNLEEDEEVPRVRTPVDPNILERRGQDHLDRVHDDPFYILGDNRRPRSHAGTAVSHEEDFDSIPIVQFDGGTSLLAPVKVRRKKKTREIVLDDTPVDIAVDEMPENAALSDTEINGQKENRKGKSVLNDKQAKGLEDIDFEEEERMEREAIEAERVGRQNRAAIVPVGVLDVVEEPLVAERAQKKKKKKKVETGNGSKKAKTNISM
jgi:hypothetical protein